MAQYEDHILQAKRNLRFLSSINQSIEECFDWQVTTAFYTALHFVNAHLAKYGQQYRKHKDVNYALNFENKTSLARLPEDEYLAYMSLQSLSRRSRYLVNEKPSKEIEKAHFTYDVHLIRGLRHLDLLLKYFDSKYKIEVPPVTIRCAEMKHGELAYFTKV